MIEQADAPLPGCSELSADDPQAGVGGDSSYVGVAFQEVLSCGGQRQQRVLFNRLHGSAYDGITPVDGLSTPARRWSRAAPGGDERVRRGLGRVQPRRLQPARRQPDLRDVAGEQRRDQGHLAGRQPRQRRARPTPSPAPPGCSPTWSRGSRAPAAPACPRSASASRRRGRAWDPRRWSPRRRTARPTPPTASTPPETSTATRRSHGCRGSPAARQIVTAQLYQPPGGLHALKTSRLCAHSPPAAVLVSGARSLASGLPGVRRRRPDRADHRDVAADPGRHARRPAPLAGHSGQSGRAREPVQGRHGVRRPDRAAGQDRGPRDQAGPQAAARVRQLRRSAAAAVAGRRRLRSRQGDRQLG